jgi:hypothetical protein
MKKAANAIVFDAALQRTQGEGHWYILRVSREKIKPLGLSGNSRRVVCTLNDSKPIQRALFPIKAGDFFITVSKKLRDELRLAEGDNVRVSLSKDTSKYGLPLPKELKEVMRQDNEGEKLFHALTPGNQRLSIRLIDMAADVDKRIRRSLILIEYLKYTDGKFVYNEISNALKARPPIEEPD